MGNYHPQATWTGLKTLDFLCILHKIQNILEEEEEEEEEESEMAFLHDKRPSPMQ